jgi:hypothetical protein
MTLVTLPPPPSAVREYFSRRVPANLGRGLTGEEAAHNDSLWGDIVAGRPLQTGTVQHSEAEKAPDGSLQGTASVTHFQAANLAADLPRCEACGHAIRRPGRRWSRFCGDACKQKAYRRRRAAGFLNSAAVSGAARAKSCHPTAPRNFPVPVDLASRWHWCSSR